MRVDGTAQEIVVLDRSYRFTEERICFLKRKPPFEELSRPIELLASGIDAYLVAKCGPSITDRHDDTLKDALIVSNAGPSMRFQFVSAHGASASLQTVELPVRPACAGVIPPRATYDVVEVDRLM